MDVLVTQGFPLGFHVFVTLGSPFGFGSCHPRVPFGLEVFCCPRVLFWVWNFSHPMVPLGFGIFLSLKGPSLGFTCFCHPSVSRLVSHVFVTQSFPFRFGSCWHPLGSLWVWMFLSSKGLPLVFNMFLSPKCPPLGFTCFCHPMVPPWVHNLSPNGLLWVWKFFCHPSPWVSTCSCHTRVPPLVSHVFVTQGSPFGFGILSPNGPPLGLEVFCYSRVSPLVYHVLSPKGPPLGFTCFCHSRVLPWVSTCFCHPRGFFRFGSFLSPKGPPFGWNFVTQWSPLGLEVFVTLGFHVLSLKGPPCVSHVFGTQDSPLGFGSF